MTWKPDTMYDFAKQRGEHGFSDQDWWNADQYLAGLIGTMALHLRDHGNGYPCQPEYMTEPEWKDILTKIGEPLVAYAEAKRLDVNSPETTEAARDALRLFAEWFDKFWD